MDPAPTGERPVTTGNEKSNEPVFRGFHPVADIFPRLDETAFAALVDDIKAHGLLEPITLDQQRSLPRRSARLEACAVAEVTPRYRVWDGEGSPADFVTSENLFRRHLSQGERAVAAARRANMSQGERIQMTPSANLRKVWQAKAAEIFKVSERSVTDAQKVVTKGVPELVKAVERGEVAVEQGRRSSGPSCGGPVGRALTPQEEACQSPHGEDAG